GWARRPQPAYRAWARPAPRPGGSEGTAGPGGAGSRRLDRQPGTEGASAKLATGPPDGEGPEHRWAAVRSARSGLHGLGQPVPAGSLQELDPATVGYAGLAWPRRHRVRGRARRELELGADHQEIGHGLAGSGRAERTAFEPLPPAPLGLRAPPGHHSGELLLQRRATRLVMLGKTRLSPGAALAVAAMTALAAAGACRSVPTRGPATPPVRPPVAPTATAAEIDSYVDAPSVRIGIL